MPTTNPSPLKKVASDAERAMIVDQLRKHNLNMSQTAISLQIDRKTLYNKLKEFGLDRERTRQGARP